MTAIQIIRLVGKEFASIPTEVLEQWIEIVRPMVSRKQFGKLYEQALALLVCHKLKLVGEGDNPLGVFGQIGIGFSVGSVSEGGSSISFGAGQSSNLAPDAELGLTIYGLQFLSLRRQVIVPIHISCEPYTEPAPYETPKVKPATDSKLGAVKVKEGSGLKLEEDGTLSVDVEGIKNRTD